MSHVTHDHNEDWGFVEVFTRCHKTARGPVKKATFLPILVPAIGIDGWNWVAPLLALMDSCGLKFRDKVDGPILRPPTSASSGLMLGMSLERPGKGVLGVTSHSLKATGLSWASKFGLSEYDRAVLGRHSSTTSIVLVKCDLCKGPCISFGQEIPGAALCDQGQDLSTRCTPKLVLRKEDCGWNGECGHRGGQGEV